MKSLAMLLATAIAAVAAIAASQEASPTPPPAPTPREIPRSVTTSGEIVRYDAGKTIVIRQSDDRVVTYELAPAVPVSPEIHVGRRVAITAEPAADGVVRVTRVTPLGPDPVPAGPAPPTASVTPNAEIPSAAQTKTQTTTAYGTITAYEPGQSISILQPNGKTVIYAIDGDSALPSGIATGKTVVVRTITRPGATRPVLRKVTYSTGTATTKKKG
jgi:hypothetical protein